MSEPQKLPGLTGMNEAQLREQYAKELGQEVPAHLSTIPLVREAIKGHREKQEAAAELAQVKQDLADEQAAHATTKQEVQRVTELQEAGANTIQEAARSNAALQQQLADERAEHEVTKRNLNLQFTDRPAVPAPGKDRGALYVNTEGEEKYFTDETVKVAGAQNMEGWEPAAKKPEPLEG